MKESIPLDFSHQDILETRFHTLGLNIAEYSFANLYLFRHIHKYEVITYEKEIFIQGMTRDNNPYLMPTSHPNNFSSEVIRFLSSNAHVLFPILENWLRILAPFTQQVSCKEEDSDYLFHTTKLASFPGRHLNTKRNLVKQLFSQHVVQSENLVDQWSEAKKILNDWQEDLNDTQTDYYECQEAIQQFHRLHLHGRILYVDQIPAAFCIGEKITPDCYVVHFAKASKSIKGLYQYLYQDIAQSMQDTVSLINLEQDLGIESIRQAKKSYLPDQLLRKWSVKLRPNARSL